MLYQLHQLYPDAPIFTSVYEPEALPMFDKADVRTTWLQKLPFRRKHQLYALLRPWAFRSLDLSEFDVVLTSSSAESKQVRVRPGAVHICYCNTPIRYYWSHYQEYRADPGFGPLNPLVRLVLPLVVKPLRWLDYRAAQRVTYFIANSNTIKDRIKKYYRRDSAVIWPPADLERFAKPKGHNLPRRGFLAVGRQVPYKRIGLAVAACTKLNLPLTVIGRGSEHEKLKAMAGPSVTFLNDVPDDAIASYFHQAEALIFPSEEDFGILPVEAMAAGCPVIAYGVGGARDTVVEGKTGLFFERQTVTALEKTLQNFSRRHFDEAALVKHAAAFSNDRFRYEIESFVNEHLPRA